jgi:demethylmenaquinone methyltransferase / 2-methoxy-6-polyprenyl-1,4-benzoquinol methylase
LIKPYSAEGSKKDQVAQMFDNIAGSYDGLNRFLSLGIDQGWRRRLVREVKAKNPALILDMATGTADVALALAKAIPEAKVVGVDISAGMLEVGRKKVTDAQLDGRINLLLGDSEAMQQATETFDVATVAFGVRNYENLEQGLKELYRVLKPGGTLHVLEFSRPSGFPIKQLFQFYFRYILPMIGRITSRDTRAYSYLYESVQSFPDGEQFNHILLDSGFKIAQCQRLTFGICSLYTAQK